MFASGQAATTTALLALLAGGDEIVCSGAIYGGTLHLLADVLPKFGIQPRFVTIDELRQPDAIFSADDEDGLVRVADQSDAAVRRHCRGGRGVSRAGSRVGRR